MKCPKRQFENREGAKFCDECGQKLEVATVAENETPEADWERNYITALFSDLSGYTPEPVEKS